MQVLIVAISLGLWAALWSFVGRIWPAGDEADPGCGVEAPTE